jgi:hypothetical protein
MFSFDELILFFATIDSCSGHHALKDKALLEMQAERIDSVSPCEGDTR